MIEGFWNKDWQELCFAVVGIGLIGGSYVKALRKLKVKRIIGIDRDKAVLQQAAEQGLLDAALLQGDSTLAEADVIICALYPDAVESFVKENAGFFKPDVLLTDVAGVKGNLPERVQALLKPGMEFISGHPMAGKQSSGFAMSDAAIFQGANYIVVPSVHNTEAAISWLERFAAALGCRNTVRVTPAEHDSIIAYTSNLPHAAAVALINSQSYNEKTPYFVAGSFRDATRVADINPDLWTLLFLSNKEAVADKIEEYIRQLELWRDALRSGDGQQLREMMSRAAARRKELY